jgi:uncharacterized protein (TIGR02001 family)
MYPGTDDSDFGELLMTFSYNIASLTYAYSHNLPDYDGDNEDDPSHYLALGLEHKIPQNITLGATAGYYTFPDEPDGEELDYMHWMLSAGTSLQGFDFTLAYTDTDKDNDDMADGRVTLTLAKEI